ncbi:unnamed protein product [Camellia sinensis]
MWAKSKGIPLLASISEVDEWLVIEKAKRQWEKYKSMLDDAKAMKEKIDEELSSGTQENAAVSGCYCSRSFRNWFSSTCCCTH